MSPPFGLLRLLVRDLGNDKIFDDDAVDKMFRDDARNVRRLDRPVGDSVLAGTDDVEEGFLLAHADAARLEDATS